MLIIRKFIIRCKSPNIDHYRSGSNTDSYEGQEGKVNKIEEKLLKLRLHVDKLKNELETLTGIRFEEAQISHKLNEIISYQSTDNFKNNNLFDSCCDFLIITTFHCHQKNFFFFYEKRSI